MCGEEFWIQAVINHIHAKAHWGDEGHIHWLKNHKKAILTRECGNANPKGNVAMTYKGGCMKTIDIENAYRCTGCGGWFHKECILKHFKLEKNHDWGRMEEQEKIVGKIEEYFKNLIFIPFPQKTKHALITFIKKSDMTSTKIKVGDMVWSGYFNDWIKVEKIISDTDWYFNFKGRIIKAQTALSFFEHFKKL